MRGKLCTRAQADGFKNDRVRQQVSRPYLIWIISITGALGGFYTGNSMSILEILAIILSRVEPPPTKEGIIFKDTAPLML